RELCRKTGIVPLTQRRVTDLISELDMPGLVHARGRSSSRGGRTKEIQASVPTLDVKKVLEKDEILAEARGYRLKVQTTLLQGASRRPRRDRRGIPGPAWRPSTAPTATGSPGGAARRTSSSHGSHIRG